MINIKKPYLLFLGDAESLLYAKTAAGIAYFRPEQCVGYCSLPGSKAVLENLPKLTLEQAKEKGTGTFVIGVANDGGYIPENWVKTIITAIELGFDIASGMHEKLETIDMIANCAKKNNVNLHNVRHYDGDLSVGTGIKRSGKRILTVGTDCSSGKMYTALKLDEALKERGDVSNFIATGQTGILISGSGISIDAVPSDFISGVVEYLSPATDDNHYSIIEGQGSLYHPSYAGVSLGLLHGSQADYIIMCHDASRHNIKSLNHYKLPNIMKCIETNLQTGSITNSKIKCVGISVNTSALSDEETNMYISQLEKETGLLVTDPCKFGVDKLIGKICEN